MIDIRVMSITDYDCVYNLWMNTPGMGLNSTDDSREGIEKYLKRNPTSSGKKSRMSRRRNIILIF